MSRGNRGGKTGATTYVITSEKKGIEEKERLEEVYDTANSMKEEKASDQFGKG